MIGIQFIRENHMEIAEGMYLPRTDLLGYLSKNLHSVVHQNPNLKPYLPDLLTVDIFIMWDGDKFMLFISTEARAHLPTRGMETKHLPAQREAGIDLLGNFNSFAEISNSPYAGQTFEQIGFKPGFAAIGTFPASSYDSDSKAAKELAGQALAKLMQAWAERRRLRVENSRIFLSHKGVNKPFVTKVDAALRMIGLRTWFDQDDLAAGDTLVRGVDSAFADCSAAVFFISSDYVDSGVIGKEIDRAIHEAAIRNDSFRIIPLVLAQHGGTDDRVPRPLKTLVWKTVQDIDVVPTILRSLPPDIQSMIRYVAPK